MGRAKERPSAIGGAGFHLLFKAPPSPARIFLMFVHEEVSCFVHICIRSQRRHFLLSYNVEH